jgi:hypothetical protein
MGAAPRSDRVPHKLRFTLAELEPLSFHHAESNGPGILIPKDHMNRQRPILGQQRTPE